MESRAEAPPKLNSGTCFLGVVGALAGGSLVRVGDASSLVAGEVAESAGAKGCLVCGGLTFVVPCRDDNAGGENGLDVVLSGSEISVVGDLAGFRCGIGGDLDVRFTRASPCTKRDTSSN